jgi:hypothetical protein
MKVSHLYDLDKYLSSAEINSISDKILFTKWERFVMWLARCTVRKLILRLTTKGKTPPTAPPEGEICRCGYRDMWRKEAKSYNNGVFNYCPSCGKLLLP